MCGEEEEKEKRGGRESVTGTKRLCGELSVWLMTDEVEG